MEVADEAANNEVQFDVGDQMGNGDQPENSYQPEDEGEFEIHLVSSIGRSSFICA